MLRFSGLPHVERRRRRVVFLPERWRPEVGDRQGSTRAEVLGGDGVEAVADSVEVAEHRVGTQLDADRPGIRRAKQPCAFDLREVGQRRSKLCPERLGNVVRCDELRHPANRSTGT